VGLIKSSKELNKKTPVITIFGPPGGGKTVLAATMSEYWRGPNTDNQIAISDMVWVVVDRGALESFDHLGYEIPYAIDMVEVLANTGSLVPALKKMIASLKDEVPSEVKWVVIDTASQLGEVFCGYYANKMGFRASQASM